MICLHNAKARYFSISLFELKNNSRLLDYHLTQFFDK